MPAPDDAKSSDEEMRKLLKPSSSPDSVLSVLKDIHSSDDIKIVKELDSYDDVNYWIKMDGEDFLCKIHNGVESKQYVDDFSKNGRTYSRTSTVIHFQNGVMEHLKTFGINASFPTQTSIVTLPVVSKAHSPCDLVLRILHWVPGRPMSSLSVMPIESLVAAGIFLGKLDKALDSFGDPSPAGNRFHAWDQKNTLEIRPFTKYIQETKKREMVLSVLDTFQKEIIDTKDCDKFRIGINQGDFNDANVIVDDDFQVSGVIDFGDCVASWRVLDVAVGMAYSMLSVYGKGGRSISAAAGMLRGFASEYKLNELELKHLHLLVVCRLSCSVTLGAFSYHQNPENEYLLLHAQPAWNALEVIWGYDEDRRARIREVVSAFFAKAHDLPEDAEAEGSVPCGDISFPDPDCEDPLEQLRGQTGIWT